MRLKLYIDCDNEAFEGDACGAEVARILRKLAEQIGNESHSWITRNADRTLHDVNGNTVGKVTVDDGTLT